MKSISPKTENPYALHCFATLYTYYIATTVLILLVRFAGTWNAAAFDTLEALANKFIAISKRSIAELTGKAVIEQTLCIIVLAQVKLYFT